MAGAEGVQGTVWWPRANTQAVPYPTQTHPASGAGLAQPPDRR